MVEQKTPDGANGRGKQKQGTASSGTPDTAAKTGDARLQGEGDYEAARRHRQSASDYAQNHDVVSEARDAAPKSPDEARDMLEAERRGRARARGEDRRDVMQDAEIDSSSDDKAT